MANRRRSVRPMFVDVLLVAAGGAVGSAARFLVAKASTSYLGTALPYGTLLVNTSGSLVLGFLMGMVLSGASVPENVRLLVGVGFCGAFTTFSTFAVETLRIQATGFTVLNIALNNGMSIGAAAAGLYLGTRMAIAIT